MADKIKTQIITPDPVGTIEGMRDTGYEFNTALADIVDNSVDADATEIDITIKNNWISKGIPPVLKTRTKPTVAGVVKSLSNVSKELHKKNHGLIFMIDEMGKFLDYVSSVGSDLNLFQEIAENFSNIRLNKEGNPLFFGILH